MWKRISASSRKPCKKRRQRAAGQIGLAELPAPGQDDPGLGRRRGPGGPEILGQIVADSGEIYILALSPDDRWLAVGGFLNHDGNREWGNIRIYDFAAGRLVAATRQGDYLIAGHEPSLVGKVFG